MGAQLRSVDTDKVWERAPLPNQPETPMLTGDSGDTDVSLAERMAKLEGAFEGVKLSIDALRHSQNVTLAVMGIGFTLLLGIGIYTVQRVDQIPGELRGIADSISQAVTASKQAPPQVILMPAPSTAKPE